jgi:hypothetical protein
LGRPFFVALKRSTCQISGKNTAGLVKWKPGQSGNPGGRPRGTLTDVLKIILAEVGPTGKANGQLIMERLAVMAVSGNIDAIKVILDRVDGKLVEQHAVDGRIKIALSWDDGNGDGN